MSTQIICHPYDWSVVSPSEPNDLSHNLQILAWCLDRDSNPVLLRFESFPVFAMLELPSEVNGRPIYWKTRISQFKEWCQETDPNIAPVHILYEEHEKIYYHNPVKRPMYRLFFRNNIAMTRFKYFIEKKNRIPGVGYISMDLWETRISPIRKLLSYRNCRYSQWISITGKLPDDPISRVEREYIVDFKTMRALTQEESKGLVTYPGVMAFDIECYAKNHNAMPSPLNASDDAYMNSVIYWRVGRPETRKRYLIVVGECDPIEDVEIIHVAHELDISEAMRQLVLKHDPDVITGYNIISFDYWYLDQRLKRRGREWNNMGRLLTGKTVVESMSWESSAFSHNDFHILQMDGRISIDLLPNIRRDFKLDTYKLDTVAKKFLGKTKHDVEPKTMFIIYENLKAALQSGTEEAKRHWIQEMTRVARYCVQDSELVVDLFEKLNIWIALVEMSNIVGITIMDIFTRGQQVRCVSQIYDLAYKSNIVLDNLKKPVFYEFEGGAVQNPIQGLHDNVLCFDYASLYPSIIQAYNICHTTLIPEEDNDKYTDEQCHVFEIDVTTTPGDDTDSDSDDETDPSRTFKLTIKFLKAEIKRGILPQLVAGLVAERKAVRKQLEKETDPVVQVILDKRQLALKQSANSMFGFLGVKKGGKLPLIQGAMAITYKGRQLIGQCNEYLIGNYNARVMYGDSVSEDTPVLIRFSDQPHSERWIPIRELFEYDYKVPIDRDCKERYRPLGLEIWSDQRWTPIVQMIRHHTEKQMYRIITNTGTVDVTEDHSLFRESGEKIAPRDLILGQKVLHHDLPEISQTTEVPKDLAFLYGVFYSNGIANSKVWNIEQYIGTSIKRCREILAKHYPNVSFVYQRRGYSYDSNRLITNDKDFIEQFVRLFYNRGDKVVPDCIFRSGIDSIRSFLEGCHDFEMQCGGKILVQKNRGMPMLYHLYQMAGYNVSIDYQDDEFYFNLDNIEPDEKNRIIRIIPLGTCQGYVYDIETGNHHFGAGVGRLIVSNTDSTMVSVPAVKTHADAIIYGDRLAAELTSLFPPPLKLEFEKAMRIFCIKKKKYCAFLIHDDGILDTDPKNMLVRGIVLARRDNCKYLRETYRRIIHEIMMRNTITEVFDSILDSVDNLIKGQVPADDLVIVRSVGERYKSASYFMAVFASELKRIGKGPNPGDRLEYILVNPRDNPQEEVLGKRMRLKSVYEDEVKNGTAEQIDFMYYLEKVLMNPIDQIFQIGFPEQLEALKDQGFKPGKSRRLVSIVSPIKYICEKYRANGYININEIKAWFRSILKTSQLKCQAVTWVYNPSTGSFTAKETAAASSSKETNKDDDVLCA